MNLKFIPLVFVLFSGTARAQAPVFDFKVIANSNLQSTRVSDLANNGDFFTYRNLPEPGRVGVDYYKNGVLAFSSNLDRIPTIHRAGGFFFQDGETITYTDPNGNVQGFGAAGLRSVLDLNEGGFLALSGNSSLVSSLNRFENGQNTVLDTVSFQTLGYSSGRIIGSTNTVTSQPLPGAPFTTRTEQTTVTNSSVFNPLNSSLASLGQTGFGVTIITKIDGQAPFSTPTTPYLNVLSFTNADGTTITRSTGGDGRERFVQSGPSNSWTRDLTYIPPSSGFGFSSPAFGSRDLGQYQGNLIVRNFADGQVPNSYFAPNSGTLNDLSGGSLFAVITSVNNDFALAYNDQGDLLYSAANPVPEPASILGLGLGGLMLLRRRKTRSE